MKQLVVGIDEVGRGCWAGPLVAGAVVLDGNIPGLNDSKELTPKQRQALAADIQVGAAAYGLGWVDAAALDDSGITAAVKQAMADAYSVCVRMLGRQPDAVIIDGHINYLDHVGNARAVIKADASVPAVSAASIVAKVARDAYMREMAQRFPGYGFEAHVGYGTAAHAKALRELGVCELHRRSFKPIAALIRQGA